MKRALLLGLSALLPVATVSTAQAPPALNIAASAVVLEQAPVVLAIERFYPGPTTLGPPGVPALFGEEGARVTADVAAHAETQALRHSIRHPDIRVIMTITEGRYRMIARRSRGIEKLSDLKGKRIGTRVETSAAYFLERMLRSAGLTDADVTIVGLTNDQLVGAMARGEIDAMAMWEPEISNAQKALGPDVVAFPGDAVYRELYNLNTTEGALKDPAKRARIVRFVRALLDASEEAWRDPAAAQAAVVRQTRHPAAEVAAAWPTYRYIGDLHPDLLETMVAEEAWLARLEKRTARGREQIAGLIDPSVLREARALR